jgi:uncharacterized protein
MVKKLSVFLLMLVLFLSFAAADAQVADNANLFTESEISQITAICDQIEQTYQVDMFVLTSNDIPDGQTQSYADDYYDEHGFGIGDDNAGMLYLIDMNNRECYISTCGIMIDYITDDREEGIFDAGWDEMTNGQYGRSVILSLQQTERYLSQGREAVQYHYDEREQYHYDEKSGAFYTSNIDQCSPLSDIDQCNPLSDTEFLVAAAAGLIVMIVFITSISRAYNLKNSTYSYDLNDLSGITLSRNDVHFLREHVTRVKHSDPHDRPGGGPSHGGPSHGEPSHGDPSHGGPSHGGSSVHHSSGGHMHGGGGRRF